MGRVEVRSAVLLRSSVSPAGGEADFVGFEVPDCFVIGYGLDHDGRYRELPDVRVLDQDSGLKIWCAQARATVPAKSTIR